MTFNRRWQDITGYGPLFHKAAPPRRLSCLYMLDGNAVMDRLPEALLKQLADHSPPVIV